jgi:hypothetical protein
MTVIMMSGMASILYASPVLAQTAPSHQILNSEKLAEFHLATTGFIRYVKKLAINPDSISRLTDSYVSKVKAIFGPSPSPTPGCNPNECSKLPQSTVSNGNFSQDTKIKFREFMMLTSQFQKDVTLAISPSNPPHIIGQLVDIYARNVKDIFNY